MRAIILAGGHGTRLSPCTLATSKQLLPVYNKPLIYYPLSTVMLAGIRDILLITKPEDTEQFHKLLGDGSQFGISLNYAVQTEPRGVPESLTIARHFLGHEDAFLVLGDNIIFGTGLSEVLSSARKRSSNCSIFTYSVNDPSRYGVANIDKNGGLTSICEKPKNPKSNLAITGHYMLPNDAIKRAECLKKSKRGETEIVDLLKSYHKENRINVEAFKRGYAWFDCGTHQALLEASNFVETIETRQGHKIACLEEIAFRQNWVDANQIEEQSNNKYKNTDYGLYLNNLIK